MSDRVRTVQQRIRAVRPPGPSGGCGRDVVARDGAAGGEALVGLERHAGGRGRVPHPRHPLPAGRPGGLGPHYPEPCRVALDLVGQLYAVERAVPTRSATAWDDDGTRGGILALRERLRDERSRPIVREIQTWALDQRALPESSLGKAISYLLGLWTGLTRFLGDPGIPLDNNQTERGLRGVVLGRRNHYGSRSRRGTEVAALFYSLIESAKLSGVEPKRYLLLATRSALGDRTAVMLPRDTLAGER